MSKFVLATRPASPAFVIVGSSLLLVGFLCIRLPLFHGWLVPLYAYDSETYFRLAYDIERGTWPVFDERTAGYPFFLWAVLKLTGSITAIVCVQQFAILASACMAFVAFARVCGRLGAALALVAALGVVTSPEGILYGAYLISDGLYADCLLASFALLLVGLHTQTRRWLFAGSIAMGAAILLRPAGSFLIVVWIMVCALLAATRMRAGARLAFALPMPTLLLAVAAYNQATFGQFTISPWGAANLAGATATYWVDRADYPEPLRRAIREVQHQITPAERAELASSWDPGVLIPIYTRHFNAAVYYGLFPALGLGAGQPVSTGRYARESKMVYRVCIDAISEHPWAYARFVVANFRQFVMHSNDYTPSYFEWLDYGYSRAFDPGSRFKQVQPGLREYMWREFLTPDGLRTFEFTGAREADWAIARHSRDNPELMAVERYRERVYDPVFNGQVWSYLLIALAIVVIVRTRQLWADAASRALAAMSGLAVAYVLGAAMVVSLVEVAMDRYQYPTRFVYYFAPALLATLLFRFRRQQLS